MAIAAKDLEGKLHNPPPREVPLPNFVAGAGLPRPIGINFYERYDPYPDYLLCLYDVKENHYDQTNEPAWFDAALLQVRANGRGRFPPVKWIAVAIRNRSEHTNVDTYEQSYKVAAIFGADEIFDLSLNTINLVAQAKFDRHPFRFDKEAQNKQRPAWEQQRWLIVEQHAASHGTTRTNDKK